MAEVIVRRLDHEYTVLVDDADLDFVSQWKWHIGKNGYVFRNVPMVNYVRGGAVYLHRELMGCTRGDGLDVDHVDHDTLNNHRDNLRVVSHMHNMQNVRSHQDARSPVVGVAPTATGKWRAEIMRSGKRLSRTFDDHDSAVEQASAWRG